ncbi:MAG TPA: PKD domain-containing protein, partial [Bacteroidia bacterium]|nr:PKD domain-containing protein [Bacteroidia bacterium]
SVTVSLHHTYDSDLDIWLIDPSNDSVNLSNNEGGGGDDFTNTVFSMSATTSIQLGTAPFTGSYLPEISLNNLNNASDPNGTWRVCVADEAPQDTGHIIQVMISFCANPPHDPANFSGPCSMSNPAGCQCPDGSQDCDLLPDMLASGDIITQQHTETPGMITLSNATPNVGWGPMEIHGSNSCWCDSVNVPCTTTMCPNGNPPTQKLVQRIYHKNGNTITYHDTLTPGTMSYHPSHGHIHVNNWAEFTLRVRDTTIASPLNWPIVAHGSKVSFCLINLGDCTNDYGFCRDSAGNVITMADVPNAPFGLVSGCGVDQGIYTGNLDIYDQNLPDMFMDLSGVCNGDYYIVSITDPDNNFIEQNDNNNWVAVPITLTMQHMPITGSFNITSVSGNSASFSSNNTDVTSFMWDFGDGSVDSTSNPTMHTYTYGGTYTVTLIQSNPCGTDTTSQVITITGLEERGDFSSQLLKATPNPAAGSTVISYNMPESGNMSLDVYDVLGNKVANLASGTQAAGWHNETLDFNALGLADGSYFVRLVTPAHTSTMRVIRTQ